MTDAGRIPPPQGHRPGERRALDRRWLEYAERSGTIEDAPAIAADPAFRAGIEEFNEGLFFESHDSWESVWRRTPYPERLFLLGLTKIAAGLVHLQHGNGEGARRLLEDGLRCLRPFPDVYADIDLGEFRRGLRRCEEAGAGCLQHLPRLSAAGQGA